MKRTILFVSFVAILFVAQLYTSARHAVNGQTGADTKQPTVKLQGLDHKFYDVADMRGNVVLISFGATWCEPCSGELIALEELKHEYRDKPVRFFWVTVENDGQISDAKLKRYAEQHKLSFPVLRDPTKTAFLQFSQRVRLPMIVFFDKEGRVDGPAHFGMSAQPEIYKNAMRARLDKLLATPRSDGE